MVWAIVLSTAKAMRRPVTRVRQYVPAPYFYFKAKLGYREAEEKYEEISVFVFTVMRSRSL